MEKSSTIMDSEMQIAGDHETMIVKLTLYFLQGKINELFKRTPIFSIRDIYGL